MIEFSTIVPVALRLRQKVVYNKRIINNYYYYIQFYIIYYVQTQVDLGIVKSLE